MPINAKPLLVVDGYNVLLASDLYSATPGTPVPAGGYATVASAQDTDVMYSARERLVSDVAAYAHGTYEACVVFDGTRNKSKTPATVQVAGVRVVFSREGETADDVIERLVTRAREQGRQVTLVTNDRTIRSSVGSVVTRLSSTLLLKEIVARTADVHEYQQVHTSTKMTIEQRIDEDTRRRLWEMLGR